MGLTISSGGGNRTPLPLIEAGFHRAVCCGYADLGTQTVTYNGETKVSRRVLVFFSLPDSRIDVDGKSMPRQISQRYTMSIHEKATLRKVLDTWAGRSMTRDEEAKFDFDSLIGRAATLTIAHRPKKDGSMFASIAAVGPHDKRFPTPTLEIDPIRYETCPGGKFVAPTEAIPAWVRAVISESAEAKKAGYTVSDAPAPAAKVDDDEVPY
jgi:hypothetical protein